MPAKNSGTFSYPGGKTTISPWIIDHFPDHDVYVEPFGGSASVLMAKPPSNVEVYNDTNQDCVSFFEAVKSHPATLERWVKNTPYSRHLFEEWSEQFAQGKRPDDVVEQAGRFWFLTTSSFSGKIHQGKGTFSVNKSRLKESQYGPTSWQRKSEQVKHLRDRFHNVQIECLDFTEVFEKYDSEDTLFYCDPPYVNVGEDYYKTGGGFAHDELVKCLENTDGKWLVSYDENVPDALSDYRTVTRSKEATMSKQRPEKVETLTMNYDPKQTPSFTRAEQETLF